MSEEELEKIANLSSVSDEELQKIQDMGTSLGFLKTKVPIDQLIDRRFIPESVHALKLDLTRLQELAPQQKSK